MSKTEMPSIRFYGFDNDWEQRKLSEITDKATEKNAGLQYVETFTNSAEFGIISQRDFFDHDIAKLGSLYGYYIVKNEDFVYNPRISTSAPVGPINRNKLGRTGVMSPLYTVFRPHDIDTTYLEYFFKCGYWHSFMNFNGDSGARSDRFSIRDNVFFQMPIPIPDIDEQRKIGELLTCLDNLITLHQRKFEKLTNVKKSMLEKMFPQNGSSYPEIRFKGFTDPWEQRKFGEVFDCTVPNNTLSRAELSYDEGTVLNVHYGDVLIKYDSVLDVQKDDIPRIPHRCREDFNGALLQDGDVIIADTAEDETTGKACEIGNLQGSAIVSGLHTMVCRPRNRMALGYLGYYLNSNACHHQLLPPADLRPDRNRKRFLLLPAVQEKQRGDTAAVSGEAFSWIITSTEACLKKASSAQKNRVSWDFFVPMHSFSFLTRKNPPDPLSDNSASSPDLSPGYSA